MLPCHCTVIRQGHKHFEINSATDHVPPEDGGGLHVLETEFTQVDFGEPRVLLWVGTGVPRRHLIAADLQLLNPVLLQIALCVMCRDLMLLKVKGK